MSNQTTSRQDSPKAHSSGSLPDGPVLLCYSAAILWLAVWLLVSAAGFVWILQTRQGHWRLIPVVIGGGLLMALTGLAVLWAVGLMIVRQKKILRAIRSLSTGTEIQIGSDSDGSLPEKQDDSIAPHLQEIRDILLMSPEQQEIRRMQLQSQQADELIERFDAAMHRADFRAARDTIDALQQAQPDHEQLSAMSAALEEASRSARKVDLESARQRVSQFISAGQFDKARDQAKSIDKKYPDEPLGSQLLADIDAQQHQIQAEQIRKQYNAVDRLAEDRQWTQAVKEARKFLETWPKSKEADLVRATLPTLEDNARLAEVRRLRDKIRDLIGRKQYVEAMKLARKVVKDYPETAAARELASQMDRLQHRAENQEKGK